MSTRERSSDSTRAESQVEKFRDLARQLGADESEEAFRAKVVKVARTTTKTREKGPK